MKFLKLLRIDSVFLLVMTQLLMYYAVITPILQMNGLQSAIPFWIMVVLILGTALITMGGYVINDYFDTRIDEINKPHKVLIGKAISRHKAMSLHQILTVLGIICGAVVAYFAGSITIGLIFVMVPGLLWFYSSTYKRQFFIGNVIVGLITAFVPMIMAFTEVSFQNHLYAGILQRVGVAADIYMWVGFFAVFAFTLTVLREMVKDLEDEEGDRELECSTVPIVLGQKAAKAIIAIFSGLLIVGVIFLIVRQLTFADTLVLKNFLLYGVCAPLVFFVFMLFRCKTSSEYALARRTLKIIMVIGLLFSLVFYFAVA